MATRSLCTVIKLCFCLLILLPAAAIAQKKPKNTPVLPSATLNYPDSLYKGLNMRLIGPFRGGRSAAVTGVPGKPNLFYFGSTGGGVWRTRDGGSSWENISDGFFGGSIGAVAVSEYDNNVLYVGGGEETVRGNVSFGSGMWKSEDAGKTWKDIGLKKSRHISRIRIHPRNPELVYVAVMGDLFQSSEERGVYRSKDGGKTWERILFANADAGAIDLIMDPANPRILYAGTWRFRRTPYDFSSGGEGSGLWKSTDGGDTWTDISRKPGLPKGTLGIVGVTVSPLNSNRVWAIIEAEDGGVFRSDDAGDTWQRVNESRDLRQRAWYYNRIYADTRDINTVYVVNVSYHRSSDGGRTFEEFNAPHGDHHDLWIDPNDSQRMIIGDDGGAQVSFDGGKNWSSYLNQPTAQFYRLATDNFFPYRIYAAQQDNSAIRILHRSENNAITERDWESSAGGESAHMAVDPQDPEIVYGSSYGGFLTRVNHRTGELRAINVWPDNPLGHGAEGMKYRFQWNFPVFFSPNDPDKLYACSNQLHVSTDEGQSWQIISPDLTRNDSSKLKASGGPITKDNTGVEYYCTIFAAAESPLEPGLIWTGSDDGLLHITRDGGKNWEKVTPPDMPEWSMINSIEVDPFVKGGVYVAATRYKSGDYRPYLYKSKDYGKTWTQIVNGIAEEHFTRVLRADPRREGLLYAGTESGMYISFDDGTSWKAFTQNLPIVPITDLHIKNDNLIVATQGRSIWIIDDLTPLRQLSAQIAGSSQHLYTPLPSYRMEGYLGDEYDPARAGTNHPGGVMVHYYLKKRPADSTELALVFLEQDGGLIRRFSSKDPKTKGVFAKTTPGLNRFVWDMRYEGAKRFDGMITWFAELRGPRALPGTYRVRLVVGKDSMEQTFEILKDPRVGATMADMQAQFDFLMKVRDKLTETHETIENIRSTRNDLNGLSKRIEGEVSYKPIGEQIHHIDSVMSDVEKKLYQTQNRSPQDPLNYPIRLNNKLGHVGALTGIGDYGPTQQAAAVYQELSGQIDQQLARWQQLVKEEIPALNQAVKEKDIDMIRVKAAEKSPD
ncbi:MAG: glycosyl hydrolase [Bacteroidetes bacterium]|nr:MAG: glycosyl hydrolase [Bacteroidota bacterium]